MQDSTEYKVIGRRKFVVIMVILVSLLAVGLWMGLDRLAEYGRHLEALAAADPVAAEARIRQLVRILAISNGVVLFSFAALIIVHGWRGWRTSAMPPAGSSILQGQRTWRGEPAVRVAKFTVAVGIILALLAVVSTTVLWGLGDTLMR